MESTSGFVRLLRGSCLALLVCAVLVALCYFFVDKPVAFFVAESNFARYPLLKQLTYPPPILQELVPVVLVVLVVRRAWGPFCRWELALLAAGVAIVLADQFKQTLAFGFGRYWPDTWINNNPSLLQNGAYGFHPFHKGVSYASFPSGHTARSGAAAAVVWIAYPRWRWLAVLAPLTVITGLIGMNYHFVSDVIAGGFVGALVGVYAAHFSGLRPKGDAPVNPGSEGPPPTRETAL